MKPFKEMQQISAYNDTRLPRRTPSPRLTANSLFTFTTKLCYLEAWINNGCISARYCREDIRYLKIGIPKIALPMKCFCDINIHNLGDHLDWYGYFGLGFSKEWGTRNGIQPIQYVNEKSALGKDFRKAFKQALKDNTSANKLLRNYIADQLVYFKPCMGKMLNRLTNKTTEKCFTDESEWRFVPDVSTLNMPQILSKDSQLLDIVLARLSDALNNQPAASIPFDYQDIKYIVIENKRCLATLISDFDKLPLSKNDRDYLVSKILIWDELEEDI